MNCRTVNCPEVYDKCSCGKVNVFLLCTEIQVMNFESICGAGVEGWLHEVQAGTQYHISQKGKHSEMCRKERDSTMCVNRQGCPLTSTFLPQNVPKHWAQI